MTPLAERVDRIERKGPYPTLAAWRAAMLKELEETYADGVRVGRNEVIDREPRG